MATNPPLTVELLNEICEAFNRQDVDAIVSYFAEDGEWLMARGPEAPWGRRLVGRQAIANVLRARYKVIPDMRWVDLRHWVAGEQGVSEWRVLGTPASGPPVDWLGCDLWAFRGGRIVTKNTYWKLVEPA
jgi:taurine dehydrogenase small subunit